MAGSAVLNRKRIRIDSLLVERGLAESRQKARALILAGQVLVAGAPVTRAGALVEPETEVEVRRRPAYVGRGGEKLEHALRHFELDVRGWVCADIGASTGGFTDCLLQRGAARVYAVDVGYGELAYRLRQDPRVVVMERTNARDLGPLPDACDLATIDVSFIGVEKVLPAVMRSLKPGGLVLPLVKPQFQAGRVDVPKDGVVRDARVQAAAIGKVVAWAVRHGLRLLGLTASPLAGAAGNREFFLLFRLLPAAA
jgi:23S rRNA (cytidine1920-2'-O)/16S rRNA (cytidine1409-2'-O)-methyltransferase